jgi:tetratricopeptide (TPR) repeat protein
MGSGERWGNDITLIKDTQEKQPVQEPASLPVWTAEADPVFDIWNVLERQEAQRAGSAQDLPNVSPQLQANTSDINSLNYQSSQPFVQREEYPLETWSSETLTNLVPEDTQKEAEHPLWDSQSAYNDFREPSVSGDSGTWPNSSGATGDSGIWSNPQKENAAPSPPAWLNMLTQSEIRQLNDEDAPTSTPAVEPVEPAAPVQSTRNVMPTAIPEPANDEEEAFSFGPAWLKSLGAASLHGEVDEAEVQPSSTPAASEPLPVAQRYEPEPVAYEAHEEKTQEQPSYESFVSPTGSVEQDVLTTLENLEAGLLSQGFVPLEPNTLQTIAKTKETLSPDVLPTPEIALAQEEMYQHDALPALFSSFESFAQEPVNAPSAFESPFAPSQAASDAPFEEPSWLTALNAAPSLPSSAERQQEMQPRQEEQAYASLPPVQSPWNSTYIPQEASPVPLAQEEEALQTSATYAAQSTQPIPGMSSWPQEKESAQSEEAPISLAAQPTWSQMNRQQEVFAAQTPTNVARQGADVPLARQPSYDYLLNNELETTMKRPAVRLQPIEQANVVTQNNRVPLPARARMAEQSHSGRGVENNLSYQERLLKGYQHQLVGDYDEAMQEYRIIIRNSPELLGEVVSNVRALLKLAPKYSTGYRVLGDAYMRQGEYLQAMEAYNKALTMAKRAKS